MGQTLLRILGLVLELLGITQAIRGAIGLVALESSLTKIGDQVALLYQFVVDPPTGANGMRVRLNEITNQITAEQAAILAAIAALPDGTSPVVLPTTPPTGYGAPTANDVWDFEIGPDGLLAQDLLYQTGHLAQSSIASGGLIVGSSDYFRLSGAELAAIPFRPIESSPPKISAANILVDDTRATWLDREWAVTGGWLLDASTDLYYYVVSPTVSSVRWVCLVDQEWFLRLLAVSAGVPTSLVLPPVWPGLDAVTLGTPVALATGVSIGVPCDGVIVSVSAAPEKQGYFTFSDLLSYRNIGALTFVDDNGQAELSQVLGFTEAVYCPRTMRHAAGVKLRTAVGVEGTVTPWTLTPP